MQIKSIKLAGLVLFLTIFVFCVPHCVLAKESDKNNEFNSLSDLREKWKMDETEALLLGVREILTHPDADGEMMAEKWLGVERSEWQETTTPIITGDKKFVRGKIFTPSSFSGSAYINEKNKLFEIELLFYEDNNIHITPKLIREIFGKPTNIVSISPLEKGNKDFLYRIIYYYDNYIYPLSIYFVNDEIDTNAIRHDIYKEEDKVIETSKKQKDIKFHDNYKATDLFFYPPIIKKENEHDEGKNRRNNIENMKNSMPKNAKDLLIGIKEILSNLDQDGVELCEKWLGINRAYWNTNKTKINTGDYKYFYFSHINDLTIPFDYKDIYINKNGKLFNGYIYNKLYKKTDFIITTELVRNIFGNPDKVEIKHYDYSSYYLYYSYINSDFLLKITFNKKTRDEIFEYNIKNNNFDYLESKFDLHDNFFGLDIFFYSSKNDNLINRSNKFIDYNNIKLSEYFILSIKNIIEFSSIEFSSIEDGKNIVRNLFGVDINDYYYFFGFENPMNKFPKAKFDRASEIFFYKNSKISMSIRLYFSDNNELLITPYITKKELGEARISQEYQYDNHYPYRNSFYFIPWLSYNYDGRMYKLLINYRDKRYLQQNRWYNVANIDRIEREVARRKSFDVHKDYICTGLYLNIHK